MKIAAVLLAAGAASRMGAPKQLLAYRGESLVRRAALALLRSRCDAVFAVVGARGPEVAHALAGLPLAIVGNPGWEEGLASSLRAGIAALACAQPPFDGVLLASADQPHLCAAHVDRLVAAFGPGDGAPVASAYAGRLGGPAVFPRSHFAALAALRGEQGGRELLQRHPDVRRVAFPAGALDVDTPEDYERLLRGG